MLSIPADLLNVTQHTQAAPTLSFNAYHNDEINQLISNAKKGHGVSLTKIQHVLHRPDTYIGSVLSRPRNSRVLNLSTGEMVMADHGVPDGLERIFLEILWNAADNANETHIENATRPPEYKYPLGSIDVFVNETSVTVRNNGRPIVIEPHFQNPNVYNPERIFGDMLVSTNFDDSVERTGGGKNGIGAKATNVFSKVFSIFLGNPYSGVTYKQTWRNNMEICEPPIIEYGYSGMPFTQITYEPDFTRIQYPCHDNMFIALCGRHVFDVCFTTKVPVTFNGQPLNGMTVTDVVRAYYGNVKYITYYDWPAGVETFEENGVKLAKDRSVIPRIELCIIDASNNGEKQSYVNGVNTLQGGIHVEAAIASLKSILEYVNNKFAPKKSKKPGKRDNPAYKLTPTDLMNNVTLIINCHLPNPDFNAQMKTKLDGYTEPGTKKKITKLSIKLSEDILKPVQKWRLIERLAIALEVKAFEADKRSDSKKRSDGDVDNNKYHKANFAGRGNPEHVNTLFWVTEGDSARGMIEKFISKLSGGKDFHGTYPLRGKLINTMKAMDTNPASINALEEIRTIKNALGLCEGLNYLDDNNFAMLHYGGIVIAADADVDGRHILGLVMTYFYCKFPSLLARGFIHYLRTPLIIATTPGQHKCFYSEGEYKQWLLEYPHGSTWDAKYFKGLGSSSNEDIMAYFPSYRMINSIYDDDCPRAFFLAFKATESNNRKKWIEKCSEPQFEPIRWGAEQMYPNQNISDFIAIELSVYPIADLIRSIPCEMDGCKDSVRKCLFTALKKWGYKRTTGKKGDKVSVFAGAITEATNYHHGETSLHGAIIGMANNFVGSNNMNIFTPNGQFGNRMAGSVHNHGAAAARYISTALEPWVTHVFKKDDLPLLTKKIDEGKEIEPMFYLPILPIHMINGALGIAVGYSTFIPCYNPIDLYMWFRCRLLGQNLPFISPWYRGFQGKLFVKERKSKKSEGGIAIPKDLIQPVFKRPEELYQGENVVMDNLIDIPDIEGYQNDNPMAMETDKINTKNATHVMISEGTYKYNRPGCITIYELPIYRWVDTYTAWLKSLKKAKLIKTIHPRNDDLADTISITIDGIHPDFLKDISGDHDEKVIKAFRLRKSWGLSNMVLLNKFGVPVKHTNAQTMLESFYQMRLPYFEQRKLLVLKKMEETIKAHEEKIRLIYAYLNGDIIIMKDKKGLPKSQVLPQLEARGFTWDLYRTLRMFEFTMEKINELAEKIRKLYDTYNKLNNFPIERMWLTDLNEFIKVYCRQNHIAIPPDIKYALDNEPPLETDFVLPGSEEDPGQE